MTTVCRASKHTKTWGVEMLKIFE